MEKLSEYIYDNKDDQSSKMSAVSCLDFEVNTLYSSPPKKFISNLNTQFLSLQTLPFNYSFEMDWEQLGDYTLVPNIIILIYNFINIILVLSSYRCGQNLWWSTLLFHENLNQNR